MNHMSRGKGNGLHGITNLDRHIFSEEELEQRRLRKEELFREYNEEKANKRLELRVK